MTIRNKYGMHARPAALFVKTAAKYRSNIMVKKGDSVVSGKSIMGLLTLEGSCGTNFTVEAEGVDATEAVEALYDLVERKFDED